MDIVGREVKPRLYGHLPLDFLPCEIMKWSLYEYGGTGFFTTAGKIITTDSSLVLYWQSLRL